MSHYENVTALLGYHCKQSKPNTVL